jgi:PLP dependent protein
VEQTETFALALKISSHPEWPMHAVCTGCEREVRIGSDQHNTPCPLAVADDVESVFHRIGLAEVPDNDANSVRQTGCHGARIFYSRRVCQEKAARQQRAGMRLREVRGVSELAGDGCGVLHPAMPSTDLSNDIAASRDDILKQLASATDHPVELVAVSKKQPDERLQAALDCGQRVFGENRVQEAQEHWQHRRDIEDLCLHLIGPLQSNKSEDAVALFDVIQTVDRKKIVRTLSEAAEKLNRFPHLLIQVNTGEEDQKSGVLPADLEELIDYTRQTYPGELKGLMAIPPVDEPAGPHFALLKKLADRAGLPWVSMGMSADYELGAKLGATHVRVGSALFGERKTA